MKDMGEASYVLGVEIHSDRRKRVLGLSQKAYLNTILKRFSMEICKPVKVPILRGTKLSEEMCAKTPEEKEKNEQYSLFICFGFSDVCYVIH